MLDSMVASFVGVDIDELEYKQVIEQMTPLKKADEAPREPEAKLEIIRVFECGHTYHKRCIDEI